MEGRKATTLIKMVFKEVGPAWAQPKNWKATTEQNWSHFGVAWIGIYERVALFRIAQPKGQLNSEWIYEVIVFPKMPTKNI